MIRDILVQEVKRACSVLGGGENEVRVVRQPDPKLGDFSTNAAFALSRKIKQTPLETAINLSHNIKLPAYIKKLEVKEPGFINIYVKEEFWQNGVSEVLKSAGKFGSNDSGHGKKARVEFVSANPTGPLHFGNARGGPIGDALASVLKFSGYDVVREYYHNNVGGQVQKLGESILNVESGKKLEDQEYKGSYIGELSKKIGQVKSAEEAGQKAVEILKEAIISDCAELGITFDKIYSESEFLAGGKTKEIIDKLNNKSFLRPKDGAIWFAPEDEFLKDRETVVEKSDGSFTYFANDIAYHDLKFEEGADLVVDVFGANHHGHVPRLQAAVKALGWDVSKYHVILYQWVRFKRGSEILKMSKRSGSFITAREVLDEIGCDAVRFFILMHDNNSPIDFDLDLAKEKTNKNPVYYVQYAHARISSILSKTERPTTDAQVDYALLTSDRELDLIKKISMLPELVEDISKNFAVHHLTMYAIELADSFHKFYENCRVISGTEKETQVDDELSKARVNLTVAAKIALQNTLGLLGVSAPEKM